MTRARRPDSTSARLSVETLEARTTPAAAGTLDTAFGSNGLALVGFSQAGAGQPTRGNEVAVQPDGKVIVVGSASSPSASGGTDMAVARLNANGSLDTTFGNGGQVLVPFDLGGSNDDVANAVIVLPTGKIVIGGSANLSLGTDRSALARLNADGSLDTTFGTGGKFAYSPFLFVGSPEDSQINALVAQPDGRIITAGDSTFNAFAVTRITANGNLDGSFGTGGVTTTNVQGTSFFQSAHAVALQADGKIVVVGTSDPGSLGSEMAAIRLNTNGTLDTGFGTGGRFIAGFFTGTGTGGTGQDVEIAPNGRIYIGGSRTVGSNQDFAVVRLTTSGAFDTTFGTGGVATAGFNLGPSSVADEAIGIALQSDGKILAGGTAATGGFSTARFASARFLSTGLPDPTYGTNGLQSYDVGVPAPVTVGGVAFQTNGELIIAGTSADAMAVVEVLTNATASTPVTPGTGTGTGAAGAFLGVGTGGGQVRGYAFDTPSGIYNATNLVDPSAVLASLFPGFTGVYRSAIGDVNGDTIPDFVVVTGPGTVTKFAVISGDLKTVLVAPTFPFRGSPTFSGGGFVSVGDLDLDGRADIVITPDQGGGPRVVVYSFPASGPQFVADFLGITDASFRGGARTAIGDLNRDGVPDIAVAAGTGGGPRIALYDGSTLTAGGATKLTGDFFAFDTSLRDGTYVAIGDTNGDGYGDLVFGAGPGGAPRILIASGQVLATSGAGTAVRAPLSTFFVGGDTASRGGVPVTVKDVDGDSRADVIVGSGRGQTSRVRVYLGNTIPAGRAEPAVFQDLDPFNGAVLGDGVFVG